MVLLYCLFIVSTVLFSGRAARLSSDILDFDTIKYDTAHVHQQHRRAIQSPDVHRVELSFQAFGKDFQLRLSPDNSVLSKKFVLVSAEGAKSRHISDAVHFYAGDLIGNSGSHVHGSLRDGTFHGRILHEGEGYSVEPAEKYFDNATEFHSVVYKDSDVVFPESHAGSCGLRKEMEERLNRRLDEAELQSEAGERDVPEENHSNEEWTYRYKRQANARQTCDLHIITDQVFLERHETKYEILRQIGEHIQQVNLIYRNTDFGGTYTDVSFAISKITVYDGEDTDNPFRGNVGVEKFLDITSDVALADPEKYCLVFSFTNRDFANGVLGLAWIAEKQRKSGGVCGTSYNAGVVTTNNYGQDVAPLISQLTFAHELGHSLGARHDADSDSRCAPGGLGGNYLMYAHASSGDRERNDKFSSCSIGSISLVLESLGSMRENCLKMADEVALCGNQILEADEECDCGVNNECGDMCCNNDCTLRLTCSPQQGPCCTSFCEFETAAVMCANITECTDVSSCTGASPMCPTPTAINDNQLCDGGRKTCESGSCSKSVCEKERGQKECQCSEKSQRCYLCCQNEGNPDTCAPYDGGDQSEQLMLNVGSPCEDFMGYCDILLRCQIATEDGPLATIFRALVPDFDDGPEEVQLSDAVLNFFVGYWWVVLIALVVLVGIMALIMFLCNLLTPTDNPWKEEVHNARRNRVNLRARRDRGSHYPTSAPKSDAITAF